MSGRAICFALCLWAAVAELSCFTARADDIRVPLTIPYFTLSQALKAQLYSSAGGRADLWRESECRYLYAQRPRFSRAGNLLRLQSDAYLNVGTRVGSECINAVAWQGIVEAIAAPYVTPDWKIKFRVQDLNLYNFQHEKTLLAGRGFDLIKGYFVPPLEQFSFDLKAPLIQLTQLVEAGSSEQSRPQLRQALAAISTVPPAIAGAQGLRVSLRVPLPAGLRAAAIPPHPQPLTQADIEAWQKALDSWDAFVVFAV